jgi:eukaryotic translation initiation factor 2C
MIDVCRAILHNTSPNALVPGQGLPGKPVKFFLQLVLNFTIHPELARLKLKNFLNNVRFNTTHRERNGQVSTKPKTLKKISNVSAANYQFTLSDGTETTVAQYFRSLGVNLQYPNYVCIEVMQFIVGLFGFMIAKYVLKTSKGAAFPIELCTIIPGQLMRKPIPSDLTSSVLSFSTKVRPFMFMFLINSQRPHRPQINA